VPRQSANVYAFDDTPDVYAMDTLWACGVWSVVPTDTGWFGWTPNSPDEEAASPAG
jgi:hypothetical protein